MKKTNRFIFITLACVCSFFCRDAQPRTDEYGKVCKEYAEVLNIKGLDRIEEYLTSNKERFLKANEGGSDHQLSIDTWGELRIHDLPTRKRFIRDKNKKTPNGCDTPGIAQALSMKLYCFKPFFEPSCNRHDFCYTYGASTYGLKRSDCDDALYSSMKEQCDSIDSSKPDMIKACKRTATIMYLGVRIGAGYAFFPKGEMPPCDYKSDPNKCEIKGK